MCCIFSLCGWLVGLVQSLWTFAMTCCIVTAVCFTLVITSMSGVALGYNYSLAEFMNLKERNVSVILKRGIFDDEIPDDVGMHRAGQLPVAGYINEDNLVTGEQEDDGDLTRQSGKSGKSIDDSIYQSHDQNRFDGFLMKLTARPLDPGTTTSGPNSDVGMAEAARNYDRGSMDQLKAIQSLMNRRKFDLGLMSTQREDYIPIPILDSIQLAKIPAYPGERFAGSSGRRVMDSRDESLRNAVPGTGLGQDRYSWINPKLPPEKRTTLPYEDQEPTYPLPATPRAGPLRSTRRVPTPRKPRLSQARQRVKPTITLSLPKSVEEELKSFRKGIIMNNLDLAPMIKYQKYPNQEYKRKPETGFDKDYEENINGFPVRKRRGINLKSDTNKFADQTSHRKSDSINVNYTKSKVKEGVNDSIVNDVITYCSE